MMRWRNVRVTATFVLALLVPKSPKGSFAASGQIWASVSEIGPRVMGKQPSEAV